MRLFKTALIRLDDEQSYDAHRFVAELRRLEIRCTSHVTTSTVGAPRMIAERYAQGLSSLVRPFASWDFRLSSQATGDLDVQRRVR
jgi:hypothetical protein